MGGPRYDWRERAVNVDAVHAEMMLDGMKSFDIDKSNTLGCSMCLDSEHKMRYRLLLCCSEACRELGASKCEWRGKVLSCFATTRMSIYEVNEHTTSASSPKKKKKKLTPTQKAFCREMADNRLRPMRIHHALSRKFATPLEDLPPLSTVQNFVNHYSRTHLENHDRIDALESWIRANAYNGTESMGQAFAFGWDLDYDGKPIVGNGSDQRPFIVGLSTKTLMMRLQLPPESFVLHVDATYKMNHCDYPVVVVGVSDRSRGFHVVALFVVSQETQPVFEAVLMSLRRLYYWVTCKDLVVQYAMADGDQAQYNALRSVFGGNPSFQFLMCFFHLMENVQKAIKSFPSLVAASVLRNIYDLHFARNLGSFLQLRDAALKSWRSNPNLASFAEYMSSQWLFGRFSTWQAFATPSGFATTNNPAETFNALLKRDYTLRRRLKMGTLLRELSACCQDQSSSVRAFQFVVLPAQTLVRRVSEMTRANLLGLGGGHPEDATCAGAPTVIRVISLLAPRVSVAPNKRSEVGIAVSAQMGSNYARMEFEGQPWGGWPVDIDHQWCPCNYWFAFGVCVHVIYALRITAHVDCNGRSILVSRKRQRSGQTNQNRGGRPCSIGPALSFY